MLGDVYSTLTLAGSYAAAVKAAQDKDMKSRHQRPEKRPGTSVLQQRRSLVTRILARLAFGFGHPAKEEKPHVPAE